ncbi:MAG: DUF3179 domain-containing protein [Acidobacteriota bacterium]|nr:DUF3179 domain-containing protein [Acidobacteriota bacterium]
MNRRNFERREPRTSRQRLSAKQTVLLLAFLPTLLGVPTAAGSVVPVEESHARNILVRLLSNDEAARGTARAAIVRSGDPAMIPALVDALFFASRDARGDVVSCLEWLSGEHLGGNYRYWFEWLGGHEGIRPASWYRQWKAALFSRIDPAFARFLDPSLPLTIRPEEIVWGGVKKDGIPALRDPPTIPPAEAKYLDAAEMVFGITVGGASRAYPQRILDWHEMVNDRLGGEAISISYCTLCGAAIAYATSRPDGPPHVFGSSGLLYRSNKLMYDEATLSLWSNLTGEPVGGRLVGSGIALPVLPMTVTTWGDWKARHPETTVLALKTGFSRNYTPGAAYGKYFASPETMFPVWKRDTALQPKAVVFAVRRGAAARAFPLELLFRERVVNDAVGAENVVIVADGITGAVRAYRRAGRRFAEGPNIQLVEVSTGELWEVREEVLVPATGVEDARSAAALPRIPGNRAFWFGWYAFFPETTLYAGCDD